MQRQKVSNNVEKDNIIVLLWEIFFYIIEAIGGCFDTIPQILQTYYLHILVNNFSSSKRKI